jgi:hypothetical protein
MNEPAPWRVTHPPADRFSAPRDHTSGWVEVITGSMFSGKSEELIRRLREAQIVRQEVQIFKPIVDDRYGEGHIDLPTTRSVWLPAATGSWSAPRACTKPGAGIASTRRWPAPTRLSRCEAGQV